MKTCRVLTIVLVVFILCSCNREESTLSEYRSFAKELKVNSSNYTEDEWNNVIKKYEKLEQKATQCEFSQKEKKELNRLRGQCAAYMLKAIAKQTKSRMEDAMEQFSDMAEGFNEALGEEGFNEALGKEDLDDLFKEEQE